MKRKRKDIKLKVKRMSDEELIKDGRERYELANNDDNIVRLAFVFVLMGTILFPTIIAPLILYPIGMLLVIIRPRKNNKIKKIIKKRL